MQIKYLYDCRIGYKTAEVWKYGSHVIRISFDNPDQRLVGEPFLAFLEVCEPDGTKWNDFLSLQDSAGIDDCEEISIHDRRTRASARLFAIFAKTQKALHGD